jgi:hypothetical protein
LSGDDLERLWEVLRPRDANTLVAAIVAGVVVQILILLLFRVLGFFLNALSWFLGLVASLAVALYILNQGVPEALGGEHVDRWIEEARRSLVI